MFCIPLIGPTLKEVSEQITYALSKKRDSKILFEFRFDLFNHYPIDSLKSIIQTLEPPTLFTLRKKTQGGHYTHPEHARLEEILRLAELRPTYFDLEYDTDPKFLAEFQKKHPHIQLILSYHNFAETPDLSPILDLLKEQKTPLFKIACQAHSAADSLKMLHACAHEPHLLGISMGMHGTTNRILAPHVGSAWTYTSLSPKHVTAEGQLSFEEMSSVYGTTQKKTFYGLIGSVSKSISHMTHNKVLPHAVYVKMDLASQDLNEFFQHLRTSKFSGLSVTMPLKETIIPYLDGLDAEAEAIGAVNTLHLKNGKLKGFNTDGKGALDALEKKISVKNKKIVVLGAGGAARAIIYEAKRRGAEVYLFNRTHKKAQVLAEHFNVIYLDTLEACGFYDVLINTTPSPLPLDPHLIYPGATVMDINTLPLKSSLLEQAEKRGCPIVFGYEMFLHQALGQFKIWEPGLDQKETEELLEAEILSILTK